MFDKIRQRIEEARLYTLHQRSLRTIQKWQAEKLRQLVAHVVETVPLYKTWYGDASISAASMRSIDDLSRLPILKKEMFLGRVVDECIDSTRELRGAWRTTSGTSGKPFTALGSDISTNSNYNDFTHYRFIWWKEGMLNNISSMRIASIKVRGNSYLNRLFIPVEEWMIDPVQVFSSLSEFDPYILSSYSSILIGLASYIRLRRPSQMLAPRYIVSFGESLSPLAHAFVSETLGCEVYDRYGTDELGSIAVECPQHNGMHINSESFIVEVVDELYMPCDLGINGRIIVTDLFNYNMPFIRYDTGDYGKLAVEPCACGLNTPRLFIGGRYSASLRFGKRTVHHLEFDGAMDIFMNSVFQYQFIKIAEDSLRIDIVPGLAFSEKVAEDINERVHALVGPEVNIKIQRVAFIRPTPRGKSRIVMDKSVPSDT